jgi:predicted metalloenzyme YecM
MKRSKLSKEKYKMCSWKRKGTPESIIKLSQVFRKIKSLKNRMKLNCKNKTLNHTRLKFQPVGNN